MPHSVKRIAELLPYLSEQDAINVGLRASVIFSAISKKHDLESCISWQARPAPKLQPKDNGSVATFISILLPFQTSSGTTLSKHLLLRELTEESSPLFVCGRLLNKEDHARGALPAVTIECLRTDAGEKCIHAYSTLNHFNIAFPSAEYTPIEMPAKNVTLLFDSLGAALIYVDCGRPCEFNFRKAPKS